MGRKKGRRRSPFKLKLKKDTAYSIASTTLFVAGFLIIISFAGQGALLKTLQLSLQKQFGFATLFLPFMFFAAGLMLTQLKWKIAKPTVFLGASLIFVTNIGLWRSGVVGKEIFNNLSALIQPLGTVVLFLGIGIVGIMIMTESSLDDLLLGLTSFIKKIKILKEKTGSINLKPKPSFSLQQRDIKIKGGQRNSMSDTKQKDNQTKPKDKALKKEADKPEGLTKGVIANTPGSTKGVYQPPPIDILEDQIGGEADRGDVKFNAQTIEDTLKHFGIKAQVIEVNLGPAVTQYAIEIAKGIKLSRITALQNDLALSLAAPTGQIRIEAPIPGRSLVGLEIPNRSPEFVTLKSILVSDAMKKCKSKTAVGLGLNVSGEVVIIDITKMPHALIAGATGSGKSVSINAFITQIIYRASPEEVRFILVDPKRVELTQYNGIPHLLTPVIVEPEKVLASLEWAIAEMEKRYKLFAEVGVRNISGYNEISGFQALPYLIIVIDELADIMLFNPSKVEDAITRLAQMARATGIHLLLATQRPSVDILTGLIKANIPCRIAFNVTTMIDSRVIIDSPGAEKLLGKGDMLYIPPDQAKPSRIQGTFVSETDMKRVINHLKNLQLEVEYTKEVTTKFAPKKIKGADGLVGEVDDMFEDAVKVVTNYDRASASLLQRRLSIGYARAARILDQLQQAGIVSPQDGSKPREVLIKNADDFFTDQQS